MILLNTLFCFSTSSLQKQNKESFASITIAAHPIDPDCCTRVSRNVLGIYGKEDVYISDQSISYLPLFPPTKIRKTDNWVLVVSGVVKLLIEFIYFIFLYC